tara:strand:+ start:9807 stop:10277 length:471 start_codon:yes stop_codon:yes gene_type:complete
MSIYKKLQSLNLTEETMVSLRYSEGTDVFVHNETEVETAMAETDVINRFSELIATRGLNAQTRWGESIIGELRSSGFLEEYARDDSFSDFISETISDNFYDFEFIESSTEKYDHKRGFCTLSAEVEIPYSNLVSANPCLIGWDVVVETPLGSLTLE